MSFIINPFRFSITGCTGSVINTTNLVAYYKFNDNTNDTTTNALNLVASGSPIYSTGKYSKAMSGNGTSVYGICADNTLFEGSGGTISVFGWVNITDYTSDSAPAFVSKWNGSSTGYRLVPRASDILVTLGNSNVTKGTGVTAGTWTHIGFTYDNTNCVIYQNGISAGTIQNVGAKTLANTNNFYVSRNASASSGFIKGLIDDVSVWQRVLGKDEILTMYQATCPLSGA